MKDKLVFNASDLPQEIIIVGEYGHRRRYLLRSAGRKFGALLCAVEHPGTPTLPNQGGRKPAA